MSRQEQMFAPVEVYEFDCDSIPAYCAAHDLKVPTFHYWRRNLRDARNATSAFIPIANSTLDGWARQGLNLLDILYDHLLKATRVKGYMQADESTIKFAMCRKEAMNPF